MADQGSLPLEDVVADCLDALERGDADALERACREHPNYAIRLRSTFTVIEQLRSDERRALPLVSLPTGTLATLGRFTILRELARGGSGIVYLARDPTLDRLVAIKALGALPTPETLERFRREVNALTRVRHRNVAAVFDVGQTEQGVPWFAMEYVEGRSLQDVLAGLAGRDPRTLQPRDLLGEVAPAEGGSYVTTVVRTVRKLADALDQVHRAGVIHRDVKPANILVDDLGELRLVDFGLARDTDSQTITRQGLTPGTPLYMAPEQIRGDQDEIGPCTDVYALGVTAYQCLALHPPFTGRTTEQLFAYVTGRDPVPLRHFNPGVPRDLETIVHKALHRQPERRYASAAALRDDLQALLELRPIRARPPGRAERVVRWTRRRPLAASLASLGFLLVALLLSAVAWQQARAWSTYQRGVAGLGRFHRHVADFDAVEASPPAVQASREPDLETLSTLTEWERIHQERRERLAAMDQTLDAVVQDLREAQAMAGIAWPWFDERPLFDALVERSELARRQHDQLRTDHHLSEALAVAGSRERRATWYRAAVPLACDAEGAVVHLFRYQPCGRWDPDPAPGGTPAHERVDQPARLVPVPVTPEGEPPDRRRYPADFLPGDECLLVTAARPVARDGVQAGVSTSVALAERLLPGDLIFRVDRRPVRDESLYVSRVLEGGPADAAGVVPFDIVASVNGRPMRGSWSWESLPRLDRRTGQLVEAWRARFIDRQDGRERIVRVEPCQFARSNAEGARDVIAPTRRRAARAGIDHLATLEGCFGVEVCELEELLDLMPPAAVVLDVWRDGRALQVTWDQPLEVDVERTAYPLLLSPENRIDLTERREARLEPGSYLALFTSSGRLPLRFPFVVTMRDVERGTVEPLPRVTLPMPGDVPEGFVLIHRGRWYEQGDAAVVLAEPGLARESTSSFLIGRYEVSMGEWLDFLNEEYPQPAGVVFPVPETVTGDARAHEKFLLEKAQIDRLMRDVPIPRHSTSQQPWVACKNGRWQPHSQQVDVDSPVVGVERMWDIVPFIEWKNRRGTDSGWTYRLPTMAEWEQAARGADGRLYVWGDQFDWRLCNSQFARGDVQVDALLLEPRGRIPTDESVYGVRDLAGSAIEMNGSGETLGDRSRELTSDEYKRMQSDALPGPVQWPAWRGGSWVVPNPASFRAASRWPGRSDVPDRGLRLVAVPREDGTR